MLGVDRLLQSCQLSTHVPRSMAISLEQRLLEPAVEVLHAAVELRLPFGMKTGLTPNRRQSRITRDRVRARPPAGQLAGIVELDLLVGPRSFQHSPRNPRTLSMRREEARRRQTAPLKASLPTQM